MRLLNSQRRPSIPSTILSTIALSGIFVLLSCFPNPSWAETPGSSSAKAASTDFDVVIYGATPAGIAAAISAQSGGHKVLLVDPCRWIGGMTTNGLSHTDFRTFEGITGFYARFCDKVANHYEDTYGADSQELKDCFRGTHGEPKVDLQVFEQMLAETEGRVTTKLQHRLRGVALNDAEDRIDSVTFTTPDGEVTFRGKIFIDATYEGDLLAAAKVPFAVGREAKSKYGESLAPETADPQVQGYNFRLIMTDDPELRVPIAEPKGYDRAKFEAVVPLLEAGKFKSVFCRNTGGIYKNQLPGLPRNKYDINDVSRGLVRLSLPDINNDWPNGDTAKREAIFAEHLLHNVGLLYFLQNDDAVPKAYQEEAQRWGWCKDEFPMNDHLPEQLYVREARRMIGQHIFVEQDTDCAKGDARAVFQPDAIAVGDYGPNCHGTHHEGPRFGGKHTGEFYKRVAPYQIPYGVITPKKMQNLLVPVAASSSHVGFCALRLEPIWSSLGEAAGYAARVAIERDLSVQAVPVAVIQKHVRDVGGALIYVADVPVGRNGGNGEASHDWRAVQWWGSVGGLHGLEPARSEPGERGANIIGQYYQTFPGHNVQLEKPLDEPLRRRWLKLAATHGADAEAVRTAKTRGEFIRAAYSVVCGCSDG